MAIFKSVPFGPILPARNRFNRALKWTQFLIDWGWFTTEKTRVALHFKICDSDGHFQSVGLICDLKASKIGLMFRPKVWIEGTSKSCLKMTKLSRRKVGVGGWVGNKLVAAALEMNTSSMFTFNFSRITRLVQERLNYIRITTSG